MLMLAVAWAVFQTLFFFCVCVCVVHEFIKSKNENQQTTSKIIPVLLKVHQLLTSDAF